MSLTNDPKVDLRRVMRRVRREVADDAIRSSAIVDRLGRLPEVASVRTVMVFDPIRGEPDIGRFVAGLRASGVDVVAPGTDPSTADPVDASVPDLIVVPGLAFTEAGDRLGQGGGWYDRYLARVRPDCVIVAVCFDEQVIGSVPVEPHDVRVGVIVTPTRTIRPG